MCDLQFPTLEEPATPQRTPIMRNVLLVLSLSLIGFSAQGAADIGSQIDCSGSVSPYPLPVRPSAVPPVAYELTGAGSQHGAPRGTLARYSDESQSIDRVLMRLRTEHCQPKVVDPGAGYVRQTEHDNTPYRFNANTGFTAAEFDAWMKERGIRIVNGRAVVGGRPEAPVESQPVAAELECAQAASGAEQATGTC